MKLLNSKYIKYMEVLGNEERMKMLELISEKEMSVQEVNNHFFAAQPTISYHLSQLKEIGFLRSEKRGKFVYYSLATDHIKRYLKSFVKDFSCSLNRIR